jgi:hypothetical protein
MTNSTESRQDIYSRVTAQIVAELEKGVRPWIKPWHAEHAAGRITGPLRHNGQPYSGINVLMLWAAATAQGYITPIWMTFRQALELNARVRKGEKGSPVVYANTLSHTAVDDDTGEEAERAILALGQMGSGENWVGYHVAAHLSLHKLFRLRNRPVPGFLMLDQPSQAHYPPERDENGRLDGLADEDQAAVQQLFKLLWDYSKAMHPRMQIIVTDHVELLEQWFRDLIVQRWRDGIKFVPPSWPKS